MKTTTVTTASRPGTRAARLYVESWDPSYGSAVDASADQSDRNGPPGPSGQPDAHGPQSSADIDLGVEVAARSWRPIGAAGQTPGPDLVFFVDGVRRNDAHVWAEDDDGTVHPGLAASYAAGVVRCDLRQGRADVAASRVERGLFTASVQADDVRTPHATYRHRHCDTADLTQLSQRVQGHLHDLEVDVSALARDPADESDLLIIDGPLRGRAHLPRSLGYVKTHRVSYLPPANALVISQLGAGQRTPVFLLGTNWHRYSWYLRLPGPPGSPWAGVVRLEASADLPPARAIELAALSAAILPRFASAGYKDARAPQNLIPIAGLERRLRAALGDARLLLRSLVAATVQDGERGSTTDD